MTSSSQTSSNDVDQAVESGKVAPQQEERSLSARLRKAKLPEALVIAAFPVFAQLLVLTYWAGYFSVFHVPGTFYSFSIVDLCRIMGYLLLLALIMYLLGDVTVSITKSIPNPLRKRINEFFLSLSALFCLFLIVGEFSKWLILFSLGLVLACVAPFVLPLIEQRAIAGYLNKLAADDQKSANAKTGSIGPLDKLFSFLGVELLVALLVCVVANMIGVSDASHQTSFYVANTVPECAVLYMTQDKAVCAPFDRKTKEIERTYIIQSLSGEPAVALNYEAVGPLALKPDPHSPSIAPVSTPTPTGTIPITPTQPALIPTSAP